MEHVVGDSISLTTMTWQTEGANAVKDNNLFTGLKLIAY